MLHRPPIAANVRILQRQRENAITKIGHSGHTARAQQAGKSIEPLLQAIRRQEDWPNRCHQCRDRIFIDAPGQSPVFIKVNAFELLMQ
eukprot:CAMPEP_0184460796 /NCGR_PEP_ID=MMETSP0740-20130409/41969_1 /TAXON_ID=385413 /ORGANISM="Thalassiosira miniscula, Strain CCMP1093" /LENGTH=87 /DNA_ID=CAMNT_0026834213 /DNA_START=114 /DNA_END=377 /DNA_ORIENTATION=-